MYKNIWAHEEGVIIKNKLDSPFFFFSFFFLFFHGRIKVKNLTYFYFILFYILYLTKQLHSPGQNWVLIALITI